MASLLVNEIFESIQGEGSHTGQPSIFVRLQGCPVGCSWCDTKHTWDVLPDNVRESDIVMRENEETAHYFETDVEQLFILFEEEAYLAKHIVITGGEPCMFDLQTLTSEAIQRGFTVQIETSGTFEIRCHEKTWVTLSPKINMKGGYTILQSAIERANEIKHPVAMQRHVDDLQSILAKRQTKPLPVVYLQPISMQKRATDFAVNQCIQNNWRLSLQTHKFIGVE
ncbi:7-carboxy-7-deazaguanine synthase QueE [Agaribacter flavus]|uniref:7-carboxy-7-deazaguanine synthase n=1 Tax=Agaribacter flavus TaxID=1902781 RepID=A0ABV7FJT5_9ALTE